ncbi:triacylglycerol lipase [Cupriavidus sp. SW-Y-13]|uniref:esterase/lipase family protein n=1 Tax=Cupriavidus sp. SW-Y-13 TaxID=2653854 RepID=UPI0013653A8C|nr:triacylglycerol lipase [Cupriavidus sp. SW-Y-13]MWL89621.1 alpha/beta fold hydrolase [Cupriavidus sp. SW-Y-13]
MKQCIHLEPIRAREQHGDGVRAPEKRAAAGRIAGLSAVAAAAIAMAGPASATASSADYAKTRYPIVLVHGVTAAAKIAGVIDYWYGIPKVLRANGATVYVATVPSFNSDEERALALQSYVRAVKLETGADKVNLIGHSQGGTTVRVAAAMSPQDIASVTTIGSPNRGSEFFDVIDSLISGVGSVPVAGPVLVGMVQGVANALGWMNGVVNGQMWDQNSPAALQVLTTQGAAAQNVRLDATLAPGSRSALGPDCNTPGAAVEQRQARDATGKLVTHTQAAYSWTGHGGPVNVFRSNLFDLSTLPLSAFADIMTLKGSGPNDGMVSVCSSKWGRELGSYYWNHLDQINQLFGMYQDADPRTVILNHANRLRNDRL